MISTTDFLRHVPAFAGLSDELLDRLAERVAETSVPAGEWVVREGEAADRMFIVQSGSVAVLDEGPPVALIRILRRGDILGELALLREGTRSASARARRDAQLLALRRADFEALIEEAPSFALGLTRAMGAQLAASHTPVAVATPPQTVAVVGLDRAVVVAEVAERLADALAAHGSVARLSSGGLATIDQAERDADRVVLCGGTDPGEDWTALCLREAHLVLAVTSGSPDAAWTARANALHGCELLVLGPAVSPGVIAELRPRETQVVANGARRQPTLEATARRLAGRSRGLVLSGGGARAFAHLGVIEELRAAGLDFDRIAGVSLGSVVAALTAIGLEPAVALEVFRRSFVSANPTRDFTLPVFSLLRGGKSRRMLDQAVGGRRIEELPLRFFCVSCDLIAREPVVHRTGPLSDAVWASAAIPGVFPPVATDDNRLLVDGAVLDNLPVGTMARTGEGPVIAVDVTGRVGCFARPRRRGMDRLGRPLRRALIATEAPVPRLGETIVRTLMVGSSDTIAAARLHADVVIAPEVEGIGLMDWRALDRVRELGRAAARQALATDPDLSGRPAG